MAVKYPNPTFNPDKGRLIIPVRLSYFKGFKKTASVEGGGLKYRMNGLIDPSTQAGKKSLATIDKGRKHLINATWAGKDFDKFIKGLGDRGGLFDGNDNTNDDGDIREHYEDMKYLSLNSDKMPRYLNRRGEEIDDQEEREALFVSGYHALVYFHYYPIKDKAKGGNGIFANVDAVQFLAKDEEFTGGGMDDDEIQDLGDEDDDDEMDEKPKNKGKSKRPSIDDDDEI